MANEPSTCLSQAQLLATLRSALEPGAPPPIVAAGAALAASCAAAGVCGGDKGAVQRLVTLLAHPLHEWDALQYCEHSEWVSTQVRPAVLGALVRLGAACSSVTASIPIDQGSHRGGFM